MNSAANKYGLGVTNVNGTIYLFFNNLDKRVRNFLVDKSTDGFAFNSVGEEPEIIDEKKRKQNTTNCGDFRISQMNGQYVMIYKLRSQTNPDIRSAISTDLTHWKKVGMMEGFKEMGVVVPNFKYKGKYVMYYGESNINVAFSTDLEHWEKGSGPVLVSRGGKFDSDPLIPGTIRMTDKGITLLYYVAGRFNNMDYYSVGSATFDPANPYKLVSRSTEPLLDHVEGFTNKNVYPLGLVVKNDMLLSYWDVMDEGIVVISHPLNEKAGTSKNKSLRLVLEKLKNNPILKPIASHWWESKAVFNPAAVYENGKIHLIYRAVGDNDVSVLGYASTSDGVTIDERLNEPIYVPRADFEGLRTTGGAGYAAPFFSGGAYGGCEDPRITKVGNRYYMTYVAYDGCNPPRVALTSISVNDFLDKNWNWQKPVLISRPGVVNKNACVLPEKVNGKFVIFHRIFPNILVDFVDDIDAFDGKSVWLRGDYAIAPRRNMWDSRKIGIGAPPIKTDKGWLLIYQSVGDQDSARYKMGAMLLDLENPTKVLHRSNTPILEPDQWYENEGLKYGVAYPCGAVIHDDQLRVYYGGADMVVCHASAPIDVFLDDLCKHEHAQLYPQVIKSL